MKLFRVRCTRIGIDVMPSAFTALEVMRTIVVIVPVNVENRDTCKFNVENRDT